MKTTKMMLVTLLAVTFFTSCSKNDSTTVDDSATSKTITTDDVIVNEEIDNALDDISAIAEDSFSEQQNAVSKAGGVTSTMVPTCAKVTKSHADGIYTRTIDYGTAGCTMPNGNVLKGKITISFSIKDLLSFPRSITTTSEGLYHNDKLVEGTRTITYDDKSTGLLAIKHPVVTNTFDQKITTTDSKVYTRTGTRIREFIEGMAAGASEDIYYISGYSVTTFPSGAKYTSTITTPLQLPISCKMPFPVKGVVEIEKNGGKITTDYGTGTCDSKATVTTDGVTTDIDLKKK